MATQLVKIIKKATLNAPEQIVYLNPAHITALIDTGKGTEIHHYGFTSFIGTNLLATFTEESIDSLADKIVSL